MNVSSIFDRVRQRKRAFSIAWIGTTFPKAISP